MDSSSMKINRLCIFGSRQLGDDHIMIKLSEKISQLKPEIIVTAGEAGGVCALARIYCEQHAIPLKLHFLNKKFAAGMYHHRSLAVLNDCDYVLFIYDGKSKGTKNEIELAQKLDKKYELIIAQDETIEFFHLESPQPLNLEL